MMLNDIQEQQCSENTTDFSDLKALILNCTLKKSPEPSHTDTLLEMVETIFSKNGVSCENIRPVDYDIAFGVYPDMTEHGWDKDDWPQIWPKVVEADILIIGSPIWLGEKSSVATQLIERLYAHSGETNEKGQYFYYGKTGGCIITGNEDGIKHCSMSILYALQHIGYTIPPQSDAGWIGEAGPGASYGDEQEDGSRAGVDNDFTRRNTTFATWNMMHFARMLKDAGGITAHGNQRTAWDAGCRFDAPNPEHR
ncbi:MAG: flavodoxin family protein [Sphingomonadaceae bacterium]|nr:flavodoxin family protein [Sphingomonadaceae bacterium]